DLDGVITNTAKLHAACWKQTFDEYLQKRATETGEPFRPFDLALDYRLHVTGSHVSTAFAIFSHRVASNFPKEARTIRPKPGHRLDRKPEERGGQQGHRRARDPRR